MDSKVDQMVTCYIKFMNPIVEGKCEITDISMPKRFVFEMSIMNLRFWRIYHVTKVFNYWIFNNNKFVVKYKRSFDRVWIDNRNNRYDQKTMEYGPWEQVCLFHVFNQFCQDDLTRIICILSSIIRLVLEEPNIYRNLGDFTRMRVIVFRALSDCEELVGPSKWASRQKWV